MRGPPLLQSLRVKVAAAVILILVVAMGLVFAVQYRSFRREMLERLGLASTPLSDVIKGSLRHAMQTRDPGELAAIVDNVSRQPGVIKVFVLDKKGEIKVSPVREEIGTRLPLGDETCQACHRREPQNRSRTVVLTTAAGERVFRNVNPIRNEPACHGCHGSRDALNGVLISDFSMAEVEQRLASEARQMLLGLLLAAGVTALAITLIMNRLVVAKLERFARATRLLGRGKLDLAVPVGAADELGQLATSFNEMVEGLRRAQALRERKELLEGVLENVRDAVVVFDPAGAVIAFNRGSEVAFGCGAAEVVGRAPALLGEDHAALIDRALAGGPVAAELRLRTGDGRYFPALVHVVPLRNERDEALGSVAIVRDLTEDRARERLAEQLAQSEKLAAVGRLAAGVAHELNNPLGNVLLYAKLLLEGLPAGGVGAANAQHIVDNTLRCRTIVRSLLDSAKQSDVRMAWADLNEVVQRSVGLVAGELDQRRVACELTLATDLPPVHCDARLIQQVMVNLLQNGIDAIEDGGGRVTVSTRLSSARDAVVVGVSDNGRGVPEASRSRIFEPFYTTKGEGTGLGLAISYGIVERHRGRIWVESPPDGGGRGSTFLVELPVSA
jgi:PAS domain S-box-containing protein